MNTSIRCLTAGILISAITFILPPATFAQAKRAGVKAAAPQAAIKVTKIDIDGLKAVLKPNERPLLVNFWATWCDPCREEFPDLVTIDEKYRGKIDFITISLDDATDIGTLVPKFLNDMKASMPAYLLQTPDETAAIKMIDSDWAGSLPITVLYDSSGGVAYIKKGKIWTVTLSQNIDRLIAPPPAN